MVRETLDEQLRRGAAPLWSGDAVEREERVVRFISPGGFSGVLWSDLDAECADAVIAAQVERFAGHQGPWEWKHYSYDQPADLPHRLRAAGLRPEEAEALLVGETARLPLDVEPPRGVQVEAVRDEAGVESFMSVHEEVFGGESSWIGRMLLADLRLDHPRAWGALATAGEVPVGVVRLELVPGTDFAVLYSACTAAPWRGKGVFRSLLAQCARIAAGRGFVYMQADALPDSRPILKRLGFLELGTTTPFTHPGAQPAG